MGDAEQLLVGFDVVVQVDDPHFHLLVELLLEIEREMAAETHDLKASGHKGAGQVATDEAIGAKYSYDDHLVPECVKA
jgi:hypothetical protein